MFLLVGALAAVVTVTTRPKVPGTTGRIPGYGGVIADGDAGHLIADCLGDAAVACGALEADQPALLRTAAVSAYSWALTRRPLATSKSQTFWITTVLPVALRTAVLVSCATR